MTYKEFLEFVPSKCMYETIYDDSEGRPILVIRLLDAYGMVNKAATALRLAIDVQNMASESTYKAALAQPAQKPHHLADSGKLIEQSHMHSQWQETIAGIPVTFETEAEARRVLAYIGNLTAQPAQEPTQYQELREVLEDLMDWQVKNVKVWHNSAYDNAQHVLDRHKATPPEAQPEERNFCPRCGKRTADLTVIHTCTPPQENT